MSEGNTSVTSAKYPEISSSYLSLFAYRHSADFVPLVCFVMTPNADVVQVWPHRDRAGLATDRDRPRPPNDENGLLAAVAALCAASRAESS